MFVSNYLYFESQYGVSFLYYSLKTTNISSLKVLCVNAVVLSHDTFIHPD